MLAGVGVGGWRPLHGSLLIPELAPKASCGILGFQRTQLENHVAPASDSTRKAWLWKPWGSVKVTDKRGKTWKMLEAAISYLGT